MFNESENLRKLFAGVTNKAKFAREENLNPTMINQHLTGERPISMKYAIAYAKLFNVPLSEISKTLAKEVEDASALMESGIIAKQTRATYAVTSIEIPPLAAKSAYQAAELSLETISLNKAWIASALPAVLNIANLRITQAYGDSMSPTFNEGDVLLIDTGVTQVTVDGIYAIETPERLFIKRVRRKLDGTFEMSSDNPNVKTVEVLSPQQQGNVMGRVVWAWAGKRV